MFLRQKAEAQLMLKLQWDRAMLFISLSLIPVVLCYNCITLLLIKVTRATEFHSEHSFNIV